MSSGHSIKNTPTDDGSACQAMAFQVLDQLSQMYENLGIDKTAADFKPDVIDALVSQHIDPNEIEDRFETADTGVSNIDMMRLSCAYALGALASWSADDLENAWIGVGHAQYWMGVAFGVGFMKGARKDALSERSRAGANKRDEMYAPLRQFARKEAAAKPNGDPYPSKRNAALSVKKAVLAKAAELEIELSENQAERTITKWLDGMSFGSKE
ncbi:hypothetical protein [Caballeronia sp. INDeC2]|uniref:hypothetical protein n=1 Tax=Caballeronia sp. INDeC2 TaxID=2921747 RepID=UPI0020291F00|nr:hypothetical protein [Caballeronia sp. INDeC2]